MSITTTTTAPIISRRTKFRRAAPEPIRLTEDDLAILRHIARHRFLRSTHLIRLLPHRSYKKLLERLAALYHNGFLDRPRAQLDYFAVRGSAPMVHALGNRGALLLAQHDGMDRAQVDWTWKNRSVGRVFIDHTLMIADLMVAAEHAVRARPAIKLMAADDIVASAPNTTRNARNALNPLKLRIQTLLAGTPLDLAVVPDALFGLDFTDARKRKYFLLEADRATMPVSRADLRQTSFARKLAAYLAGGGKTNVFGSHLGIGNFRVLTVTTSRERMRTMIDALQRLTGGAGSSQFLFVDHTSLLACSDLLTLEWTSGKGELVRLTD